MKNRIFPIVLSLLMSMTASVASAYDTVKDGIYYNLNEGEAEVAGANANMLSGDMIIPEQITYGGNAYTVTSIAASAFKNASITSITIPNSIVSIGESAFDGCEKLTKACFSSIQHVCNIERANNKSNPLFYAHHLFINGEEIRDVFIPGNVETIKSWAFEGCTNITSVKIENGVKTIGQSAFYGDVGIVSATIPESVKTIEAQAFEGCTGLSSLYVGDDEIVNYITNDIVNFTNRDYQWVWDTSKNAWYILNNKREYEAYGVYGTDKETWYDGKLVIVDGHEWEYTGGKWKDLGEATDTQEVEYIERNVSNTGNIDLGVTFKSNTRIQIKFYPTQAGGVSFIGDWNTNDNDDWRVFFRADNGKLTYDFDGSRMDSSKPINTMYEWEIGNYYIKDVDFDTNNIINGTPHTDFSKRTHNILLGIFGGNLPSQDKGDYERFYYVKIYEGETLVRDFVPYYDGSAYGLWDKVEEKTYMPKDGTWTGEITGKRDYPKYYVKKEAPTLTIGSSAFKNCSSLSTVTIPESMISIAENAFYGCSKLEDCNWGRNLQSIGASAFEGCTSLSSIHIPKGVNISTKSFAGCTSLSSVILDEGIGEISNEAFKNCTSLQSMKLPSSIVSIGTSAFQGCSGILSIELGTQLKSIGNSAFSGCNNLEGIIIPQNVNSIGDNAFDGCINISSVILEDGDNPISLGHGPLYENKRYTVFCGLTLLNTTLDCKQYNGLFSDANIEKLYIGRSILYNQYEKKEEKFLYYPYNDYNYNYRYYLFLYNSPFNKYAHIEKLVIGDKVKFLGPGTKKTCSYSTERYGRGSIEWHIEPDIFDALSINNVISMNREAPLYASFSTDTYKNSNLYIVEGSFSSYSTTDGWKEFQNINEFNPTAIYTITYMVDGKVYGTFESIAGLPLTLEETPTKEGYTFVGWEGLPETMPTNDVTVTAIFTINSYTVTFVYGDEVLSTASVEYGAKIPLPESLGSDRYTLVEWKDVPETMPAHDITIYADYTDGVESMHNSKLEIQNVYDLSGRRLSKLQRGVNIVRMSDGTTQRVLVK